MGGNEPGSFSVHLCAQLGHNFHWEPHQHISDNAMIDSGQDVHLKHSWNRYSIVYICIHTSSYKKHPWTIKKRNLSVDFMVCKDFNPCSNILSRAVLNACWCDRGCPLRRWPPWWCRRWSQNIGHHWRILSLQVAWTLLAQTFSHTVLRFKVLTWYRMLSHEGSPLALPFPRYVTT